MAIPLKLSMAYHRRRKLIHDLEREMSRGFVRPQFRDLFRRDLRRINKLIEQEEKKIAESNQE